MRKVLGFITLLVWLCSCSGRQSAGTDQGDTLSLKYATLLTITTNHDGHTRATVQDPWKKRSTLQTYKMNRPFRRVIVFSTSHCQLLEYLGLADCIVGVCDSKYILIPNIQRRIRQGDIVDCGDAMSPNIEKIISLHPDAMILSPFEGSNGVRKLEKLNIPIIQAADYMETSALGRAEWMRYYGRLFGCAGRADSLFHVVDSAYQSLKSYAEGLPMGRSVLTERKTGSVWYTPGGTSSVGMIIKDAHAHYAFADDKHGGSLALSAEQIIAKAGNSDVWIFKYNGTKPVTQDELLSEYHGYKALKAFQKGEIYECNASVKPYFEETPFRPDYLLREMIILLHADSKLGKLRYYEHL